MTMTIPIRAFPVFAAASIESDERRVLITCLREADADRAVRWLEELKREGALIPDDGALQFFTVPTDMDVAFDVDSVSALLARGVTVRSVVLAGADVPQDKVLAMLAGQIVVQEASLAEATPVPPVPPVPMLPATPDAPSPVDVPDQDSAGATAT